ncbi:SGNH/GDSL hydrolase family protein [Frondihabitans cladoniiphilus]|uniref:SGNH hydrolase-type esterase domain-containing protein n=1 Tax=Frondihabitans cladoniiphilus TaxID=715785 RepID=A0ABP8VRL0_9MICO
MRSLRGCLIGGVLAASLVVLTACSITPGPNSAAGAAPTSPTPFPTVTATSSPSDSALGTKSDPIRLAIVGDSLTAGGRRELSSGLTPNTWVTYARGNGIDFVGGWAKGGTSAQVQAAHVTPIPDVDVLVLMSGTNDVRLGFTFDQAEPSYDKIISIVKPKHVIIGDIPPYDLKPTAAEKYAVQLKAYAQKKGYDFYDPWQFARDGDRYVAGVSNDGIHPTTSGYKTIGKNYRDEILRVIAKPVQS